MALNDITVVRSVRENGHVVDYCNDLITDRFGHGWHRTVLVDGKRFRVSLTTDGHPRKIAFSNKRGYWWWGTVRDAEAKTIWRARVNKSNGVLGMLHDAGLLGDIV